jgi:hypothetical protein
VLRPIAAAAVVGVLSAAVGARAVNFVNAMHLAKARGIEVRRTSGPASGDYAIQLEVRLEGQGGATRVVGALLGEAHSRIVCIGDYRVNVAPRGTLVVLRNRDVPGVIGRVGTVLGDSGTNIGEYHQARLEAGGVALAAISVDGRLGPAVVGALRRLPEVLDVRQVELDGGGTGGQS